MGYGDVQMIDENGIRVDGRKAGDVRPISIELGVVPVADGSCRMTWGTNEVIVAVYGPMEAHPGRFSVKTVQFLMFDTIWLPFRQVIGFDPVLIAEVEKSVRLLLMHLKVWFY